MTVCGTIDLNCFSLYSKKVLNILLLENNVWVCVCVCVGLCMYGFCNVWVCVYVWVL
jgi:hypothetical protein